MDWSLGLWMIVLSQAGAVCWIGYHISNIYDKIFELERDRDKFEIWKNSIGHIPEDKEGWGHEFQDK